MSALTSTILVHVNNLPYIQDDVVIYLTTDMFQFTDVTASNVSHTRTVVRECFKGDEASQWKRPKFDPSSHQNPLTDLHKN